MNKHVKALAIGWGLLIGSGILLAVIAAIVYGLVLLIGIGLGFVASTFDVKPSQIIAGIAFALIVSASAYGMGRMFLEAEDAKDREGRASGPQATPRP